MAPGLTLYGRAWCHLCDDMKEALERLQRELGFDLAYVDVDEHPELEALYDELVPVLTAGRGQQERELCHYHLDESAVRAHCADFR